MGKGTNVCHQHSDSVRVHYQLLVTLGDEWGLVALHPPHPVQLPHIKVSRSLHSPSYISQAFSGCTAHSSCPSQVQMQPEEYLFLLLTPGLETSSAWWAWRQVKRPLNSWGSVDFLLSWASHHPPVLPPGAIWHHPCSTRPLYFRSKPHISDPPKTQSLPVE